ncbi:MAG TPA: hypothetical protein VF346_02865 [Bacteroidales bacterium]
MVNLLRVYKASKRFEISIVILLLVLSMNTSPLYSQFLKDSTTVNLIKEGIKNVYNFQFSKADRVSEELRKLYPGQPVVFLFEGMENYWRNYPLITTSAARASFEGNMRKCIELCDKNKNKSDESEILLLNLCARGLLLLYYTDNYLNFEVFPLATSTYQPIRHSFDFTTYYSDFYFFTGVYNYYRVAYPDAYPIYKPLALLFPKGSKTKGLEDLLIASKNSIFLKAEAFSFLSAIFLTFENNFQMATYYSKSLHNLYPDNPEYLGAYIKNLLLIKLYDEAEMEMLSSDSNQNNSFFRAQMLIFNGILQEKKYHDIKKAQQFYSKGVNDISLFGNYGNEYAAYAYFGLSRISEINGDKYYKKMYRKLAMQLADFKEIDFDN